MQCGNLKPHDINNHSSSSDEVTPWWQTRGDFHTAQCPEGSGSSNESDEDDDNETEEEMEEDDDRPAGLTECSLSSSVVPRSEGMFTMEYIASVLQHLYVLHPIPVLTLLDNRFEKVSHFDNGEYASCVVHLSHSPSPPFPFIFPHGLALPFNYI